MFYASFLSSLPQTKCYLLLVFYSFTVRVLNIILFYRIFVKISTFLGFQKILLSEVFLSISDSFNIIAIRDINSNLLTLFSEHE